MGKTDNPVFSAKRGSNHNKQIAIGTIVCLVLLALFILLFEDLSLNDAVSVSDAPSHKIKIDKKPAEAVLDDEKMIEEKDVDVVAIKPKPKVKPKPVPKPVTKPKPAAKRKSEGIEKGQYLQVGAYANKKNYEKMKSKMTKLGYPTGLKISSKSVRSFKVTLGRFSSLESAKDAASELKRLGYKPKIDDHDDGRHEVSVPSVLNESKAKEIKDALAKQEMKVKIYSQKRDTELFALMVGPYGSKSEGQAIKKELKEKGIDSYLFFIDGR